MLYVPIMDGVCENTFQKMQATPVSTPERPVGEREGEGEKGRERERAFRPLKFTALTVPGLHEIFLKP